MLHKNYLLPINSIIGQDDKDTPVAGVGNTNPSSPVPPVDSEPADAGPSGMVTSSTAGNTPQGSLDQPAPLRCNTQKPGTDSHGGTGILVCKQVSGCPASGMHGLVFMPYQVCTMLSGEVQCEYLLLITCLQSTTHLGIEGNFFNVVSVVDFWMVQEWTKDYLAHVQLPHQKRKKSKISITIETHGVCSSPTQKIRWQT